jgi:hypothetical protein
MQGGHAVLPSDDGLMVTLGAIRRNRLQPTPEQGLGHDGITGPDDGLIEQTAQGVK